MRLLIMLIPTILLGGGFGIGFSVGGNYQWYDRDIEDLEAGDGMGFHLGLLIEKSITPSRFPVFLSSELDLGFCHTSYSWIIAQVGEVKTLNEISLNSLYLPLLLKFNLNTPPFGFSLGLGGYLLHNLSGRRKWRIGNITLEDDLKDDELETDLGLLFRVSGTTRIAPMVYFQPRLALRYNLTPDENYTQTSGEDEKEYGIEFGMGIGIGL